jgi:hypothetical protein
MNCSSVYAQDQNTTLGLRKLYKNAVLNAMCPDQYKISRNLIPINDTNSRLIWKRFGNEDYVLVVSWKSDTAFYNKTGINNTGDHEIWVTVVPELKEACIRGGDNDLRLMQRLGLPPNTHYKYFVELWVKPSDLFRPCPDKEILDSECQLFFPSDTDSTYVIWFNSMRVELYNCCNLYHTYPWTQLGYTYDWYPENNSHVGLSEFVIGKNKTFMINGFFKTSDYCGKEIK